MSNGADVRDIPEVYHGVFPKDFIGGIDGWNFTREDLEKNNGQLLTMDIDFGNSCNFISCPHCFRRGGKLEKESGPPLTYKETTDVIKQAKNLGLRSVKFLGAGEPFEERNLLEFLEFLKGHEVKPLIFTKGHIIGDNLLAHGFHSQHGGYDSRKLAERLYELDAKILLGFRSFDYAKEDRNVGMQGYSEKRDRALKLLVDTGFNKTNPTSMGLMPLPITRENYDEAFEIYEFGKRRNMGIIVTPTMVSGRCAREGYRKSIDITDEQKIELYRKIYAWNIINGIHSLEDLKRDGVSAYAGEFPCQQVGCGVYVTLDGTVLRCPGDDVTVFGNVRERPLKDIWEGSENYARAGTYNCRCPPKDGVTIPSNLYDEVVRRLENNLAI